MSPSRISWSEVELGPSCAVFGTMRLLSERAARPVPRDAPLRPLGGDREWLVGQRRLRGRRAGGRWPPPLRAPRSAPPTLLPAPLPEEVSFGSPARGAPFAPEPVGLRVIGLAPGRFAGCFGSSDCPCARTGFWPGRGARAFWTAACSSFLALSSASILRYTTYC